MGNSKIMMTTSYIHAFFTKGERADTDEEVGIKGLTIDPVYGACWTGHFLTGLGVFGVQFPVDDTRLCTEEERLALMRRTYFSTFGMPPYKLKPEDFADQAWCDGMIAFLREGENGT